MKKAEDRVIEQLRAGNPFPFAEHIAKQLDIQNRALHVHAELIYIGRSQGECNTLQTIHDDLERAGLYRP